MQYYSCLHASMQEKGWRGFSGNMLWLKEEAKQDDE
jgi:hypothetical protein